MCKKIMKVFLYIFHMFPISLKTPNPFMNNMLWLVFFSIYWIILLYSRLIFTNNKWPFARIINLIKLQALHKQISVFSKLIIAISFLNLYKYPWKSKVGIWWPRYEFVLSNFLITNKLELYMVPFDFCYIAQVVRTKDWKSLC